MTKEKMIDVKCSACGKDMQMPASFIEKGKEKGIDSYKIPHICADCTDKMGDVLGDEKMKGFMEDINKQMEKMGKNNELAEQIAEEITNSNIDSLFKELKESKISEKDKVMEAFYRGAWMTLFLIGNNHESDFLKREAELIRDFHKKMEEREKNNR